MQPLPVGKSITVSLDSDEQFALAVMRDQDMRYPKQQIKWLIRQEAQRRGLLPQHDSIQLDNENPDAIRT